ncbi:unnamed protein product [Camellia sinensis]
MNPEFHCKYGSLRKPMVFQLKVGATGIVPASTVLLDVYWKEMDGDTDWARANESYDGVEEGCDSSRDEISSVSSYNPAKENIHRAFGSSLSLQSSVGRSSNQDASLKEHTSIYPYVPLSQLSVAAEMFRHPGSLQPCSPSHQLKHSKFLSTEDDLRVPTAPGTVEPVASFDMIGGALTFFHEEGFRRCLELSITLEMSETISRRFVHPSWRHSPTITKVHSDHHEAVADLVQTSFLFSIPTDGPMLFSTPHISVQWALRFEFFTTPKNVDWTRFEHPLLMDGRDKCEWVLPITVHAPPLGTPPVHTRNEKPVSLEPLWVHN